MWGTDQSSPNKTSSLVGVDQLLPVCVSGFEVNSFSDSSREVSEGNVFFVGSF